MQLIMEVVSVVLIHKKNLLTNYQAQAKQMSNQELKSLQVQTTSDLKSQVDQLQETLDGYTLQEKALSTPSDPGEVQIINVEKKPMKSSKMRLLRPQVICQMQRNSWPK